MGRAPRQQPDLLDELSVHPAAEAFRLMTDDELQALADDIKANGQIHPIMLDAEGRLVVDGRNRLKACKLAGVEPKFAKLNGEDPRAYVVSANIRHRHLTVGQQVMGLAIIYPEPGQRGKKSTIVDNLPGDRRAATQLLSEARAVLRFSPALAEQVVIGTRTLDAAILATRQAESAANTDEANLRRLREHAPDLAAQVDEERLTLSEAAAALRQRDEDKRLAIEAGRRAAASILDICSKAVTIYSAAQLGERGLITEEQLTRLDEAMTLLRKILDDDQTGAPNV
jgi:hypothetical protein